MTQLPVYLMGRPLLLSMRGMEMVADTKDGYVPAPAGSPLRVYLLTQGVVRDWDTYDSCVVIAAS
jgi:hypothetical protein